MGAYFHQDWADEAPDYLGIVDLFIDDEPRLSALLPREVEALLSTDPSDDILKKYLVDELGANYRAAGDGITYRTWIQRIADHVRTVAAS